jgi:hypothetical protein
MPRPRRTHAGGAARPASFAGLKAMVAAGGSSGGGAARSRAPAGPSTLLGALGSKDRHGSGSTDLQHDMRAAVQTAKFGTSRLGR